MEEESGTVSGGNTANPAQRWCTGAYMVLRGAVDLYVFER